MEPLKQITSRPSTKPTEQNLHRLKDFIEPVYCIKCLKKTGMCGIVKDLDLALKSQESEAYQKDEWRIHFHIPLMLPQEVTW